MTKTNDSLREALHDTIREKEKQENDADTWRGEVMRLHTKINQMELSNAD